MRSQRLYVVQTGMQLKKQHKQDVFSDYRNFATDMAAVRNPYSVLNRCDFGMRTGYVNNTSIFHSSSCNYQLNETGAAA